MPDSLPVDVGDMLLTAMLSPCVGGLVRTWTDQGSDLWQVPDDRLASVMGQGRLARTLRETNRYREVALLHRESGSLFLHPRFPDRRSEDSLLFEEQVVFLTPARQPTDTISSDLRSLLRHAVDFTVASNGFLLLEMGGWDAPEQPYCLFIVREEHGERVSLVETAPAPHESQLWAQRIRPGQGGATLKAPASAKTVGAVPRLMMEASATWGLSPWDLALTYGRKQ